jgi:lactoylglutathione lyase
MVLTALGWAQQRPRLLGLSAIIVRAKDLNASRVFYGDLMGFQEAITVKKDRTVVVGGGLPQDQVSEVYFKVNNHQYIVVMPETSPDQPRYAGAAIETDNIEAMRLWLRSLGYSVPDKIEKTPTSDLAFRVQDPDGNPYFILQYTPESVSVKNVGKFLGDARPSIRILHVGVGLRTRESLNFYFKALDLREFWRSDRTMFAPGQEGKKKAADTGGPLLAGTTNNKFPEGDDYIEFGAGNLPPAGSEAAKARAAGRGGRGGAGGGGGGHIALLVPDMAKAVDFVKAKPAWKTYSRAAQSEAHVGVNHKWQGNFFDPDGTRSEFMEPDTADGLPSPMSHAPYN